MCESIDPISFEESSAAGVSVIPLPQQVQMQPGRFTLSADTGIVITSAAEDARLAVAELQRRVRRATGHALPLVSSANVAGNADTIRFELSARHADLRTEGYEVAVEPACIIVRACTGAGFFYGVQTLLQLLPTDRPANEQCVLPCVRIVDRPRFRWRGMMVDVVRHFFTKQEIMRHLDAMAMHKLNYFHWHLTDDQGWRIEIKKHPRLTEIGSIRAGANGELTPSAMKETPVRAGSYGGFYTQDDIREVVAYAADRFITVVPEIEMPGHATAAIAAYPELSCTGQSIAVTTRMGIFKEVYCAGNETVFNLLQDVLDEVIPLFPSPFIHIGGDECPRDRWNACPKCQQRVREAGLQSTHDLQGYLVQRMGRFLADRGKRLMGWDEILDGPLPAGAAVTSWRGTKGGIAAATAGHDVVMAPYSHCYLDYAQATSGEPLAIEGLITLDMVYAFEPVPQELDARQARHIMGLQGNLWTEYVHDLKHLQYMAWPRGAALAEVGWTAGERKDYDDFLRRLVAHESRLSAAGIHFRAQPLAEAVSAVDGGALSQAG